MDPELLTLASSVAATVVAALASDTFRSLLGSIFRRPRETSVIVEVDGKRVELTGATAKEAHAALAKLLAERTNESEAASGNSRDAMDGRPDGPSQSAQTVAGGDANE
jgi:hypothetical protein